MQGSKKPETIKIPVLRQPESKSTMSSTSYGFPKGLKG
jgi:hypothetical protein